MMIHRYLTVTSIFSDIRERKHAEKRSIKIDSAEISTFDKIDEITRKFQLYSFDNIFSSHQIQNQEVDFRTYLHCNHIRYIFNCLERLT